MISPVRIIEKKRDGEELSAEEIQFFIQGLSKGDVTDYQASAWLMAIYFQGMNLAETVALTRAMLESGDHYDLSSIPGPKVDKHSTGGVGDKVSIVLAPLAAACGLRVPMMSGRGLGHSGGTLDKLESIDGFNVNLQREEFESVLGTVGCVMIGQTKTVAPADKKLYALRDVTGTVECIPLIVASILSKKIAEGAENLILDVKVGSGAFMKRKNDARQLAKTLVCVGRKLGLNCRALLSNMDQPLGYAVGNSLEMMESIEVLRSLKPGTVLQTQDANSSDLKELTIQLCAQMLQMAGSSKNLADARKLAHARLNDGSAWKVFQELVQTQGGSLTQIEKPEQLPLSGKTFSLNAKKSGYLTKFDTTKVGQMVVELGGGRKMATDTIDHSVGFIFHKKLGQAVKIGKPLATVYLPENREIDLNDLEREFQESITVAKTRKPVAKLLLDTNIK